MHACVDAMSFGSMAFDEALRHFLAWLRLPGEAAQIDRLLEKLAERFCVDNPARQSADTAFVLAFSMVLLHTDLHSPAVSRERK